MSLRRTRLASSPAVEEEEEEAGEEGEEEGTQKLQFSDTISWRAGKPIATPELLKRLKSLAGELREMDQVQVDQMSLTGVAKELAMSNLLEHKDNGVKAFVACCLVDILRLCAPNAPFTGSQIKVRSWICVVSHLRNDS